MKVRDLINKKDQTFAIKLFAKKKKKNNSVPGDTEPHISNVDIEYGMPNKDRVDGVIHP